MNLRPAQWTEWKTDGTPWAGEEYDSGSPIAFDPRMPMLRVPAVDYIAAHVLAVADDDPKLTSKLTLRAGRSAGGNSLAIQYDFAASVPRRSQLDSLACRPGRDDSGRTTGPRRAAHRPGHRPGPAPARTARRRPPRAMDMELTKEIRLTIRRPAGQPLSLSPAGAPSGVHIAAPDPGKGAAANARQQQRGGNAFVEPHRGNPACLQVQLRNITDKTQPYTLIARARHLDGTPATVRTAGSVAAGETAEVSLELPVPKRGYYDVDVALVDAARRELVRRTSFALLPPDTRKHRDQSPFGTYDFGGAHFHALQGRPVRLAVRQGRVALRHVRVSGRGLGQVRHPPRRRAEHHGFAAMAAVRDGMLAQGPGSYPQRASFGTRIPRDDDLRRSLHPRAGPVHRSHL